MLQRSSLLYQMCAPMSNVKDNGQNHRVALDFLEDEAVQLILDAVLNAGPVAALDAAVAGDDVAHGVADALDDIRR